MMNKQLKLAEVKLRKETNRLIKLQKKAIAERDTKEVERLQIKLNENIEDMFQFMEKLTNS